MILKVETGSKCYNLYYKFHCKHYREYEIKDFQGKLEFLQNK